MRDARWKRHHLTVGDGVHVHRAHDVPVACKTTGWAPPVPPSGLMAMAAYGTPAGGSSFVAGEAYDAVLFRLLLQVIDIPAVLPLAHALVVVASTIFAPDAIGVADKQRLDMMGLTEIDHLARALVAQVADAAHGAQGDLGARAPQLPPTPGTFLASGALAVDFAQLLAVLTLQGAETTPRDNQGLALIGGHRRLMDLAQIDRRMATGGLETHGVRGRGIRLGQRHMEFVMDAVPDHLAGGLCGKPRAAARPKTPVRAP